MWCIINLPNGTQQAVKCDPKSGGHECLEKVCKALNIVCEMEYFGLEHWAPTQKESRTHQWINLRNRLGQDCGSCGSIQLMLALRVKFWVPVHLILQEPVRNLFYMQAKVDLIEGRLLPRDWTNAAKLSALLCQGDGIRFNENSLTAKCPVRIKLEQQQIKEKQKDNKEPVLSFKKRRLSKQKSIESFDMPSHIIASTSAAAVSIQQTHQTNSTQQQPPQQQQQRPQLQHQSYSLGAAPIGSDTTATTTTTSTINSIHSSSLSCSLNNTSDLDDDTAALSPLRIYEDYLIRPNDLDSQTSNDIPDDFLRQIAFEHSKLAKQKMTPKSAKYWLLQEIQDLPGYGEEMFSGVTAHESSIRCDIAVGAHGITVATGDEKKSIPFSAIAAAKAFRRTFKLEYVNDHNERKDLEIKLPKNCIAAGLYRSITERHAFYVCDKVRGVVTNQFTRDLKGTIASMFKEDTELGKRYVFDIQMTCREVHDQARRTLYERGATCSDELEKYLPSVELINNNGKIDQVIKEKEDQVAAFERYVGTRISEAMTCKICMDREINSMINPCGHVTACTNCAAKCERCPICRIKITNIAKIFLPTELRSETTEIISTSTAKTNFLSNVVGCSTSKTNSNIEKVTAA